MGLTLKGNERFPIEILSDIKVVKIASGNDHLVLLSENGRVYTCGRGEQGQLGRVAARTASRNTRQGIGLLLTPGIVEFKIRKKLYFDDIWAGNFCTFAKEHEKGDIYVFGLNNFHQIGKINIFQGHTFQFYIFFTYLLNNIFRFEKQGYQFSPTNVENL